MVQQSETSGDMGGFIYVPSIGLYVAEETTYQEKNWYEAHQVLSREDSRMLTVPEFVGFLNHLRENPSDENTCVYNDITQVRGPWRSEWIDAYLEQRDDGLYFLTGNKTKAEKLDQDTLVVDRDPRFSSGISLDGWLSNQTSQGLPRKNVEEGDLCYSFDVERNKGAMAFVAGYDRAILNLIKVPSGRGPNFGVRAVKEVA